MDQIERLNQRWQRERNARKQAEKLLEEKSRELFDINQDLLLLASDNLAKEAWSRSILEAVAEGIITIDQEIRINSMNRAAKAMFDIAGNTADFPGIDNLIPEGLSGHNLSTILNQERPPLVGIPHETVGKTLIGRHFPLELTITTANPGNQPISILIIRDITERKIAEKQLEEHDKQRQLILETIEEGIFGLDKSGNFIFLNSAASRMLGWHPLELIDRPSHELMHHTHADGSQHAKEDCPIYKSIRDNRKLSMIEDTFWRKDGSAFPVEYFSRPLQEEGETTGVVVTFRDITQRKDQEEDRKKIEIQLRQAQKLESIGQLAAGIAHEINTPTQYANDNTRFLDEGFTDLMQYIEKLEAIPKLDSPTDESFRQAVEETTELAEEIDIEYLKEEIPQAIEQSLEGLGRISKIVRAMKEFSHPGVEEKIAIDINKALDSTIDVSRNEWKYHADIVTDFAPSLPNIRCLPGEINQAFLNIIVNAAHAIKDTLEDSGAEKGIITISTRQSGNDIEIVISDNGSGIPAHILPRIFDPFFTTKQVGQGSGQGLAIAYSAIVDKNEGTIEVANNPDKGAAFTIRLPLDQE